MSSDEWDACASACLGALMVSWLENHPAPAGSAVADDLRGWADRLRTVGQARLVALDLDGTGTVDGPGTTSSDEGREAYRATWQNIARAAEQGLADPGYPDDRRRTLYDLLGAARGCAEGRLSTSPDGASPLGEGQTE